MSTMNFEITGNNKFDKPPFSAGITKGYLKSVELIDYEFRGGPRKDEVVKAIEYTFTNVEETKEEKLTFPLVDEQDERAAETVENIIKHFVAIHECFAPITKSIKGKTQLEMFEKMVSSLQALDFDKKKTLLYIKSVYNKKAYLGINIYSKYPVIEVARKDAKGKYLPPSLPLPDGVYEFMENPKKSGSKDEDAPEENMGDMGDFNFA